MSKAFLIILLVFGFCTGCTRITVRVPPTLELDRFHRIFVVRPFNENNHVDEIFVDELRLAGKVASSGPLTMMPEDTDAVLTYDARWTWDFRTYMIDITAELHTAHTKKKLADARYYQPTVRPRPAEAAVRAIVTRLFPTPAK